MFCGRILLFLAKFFPFSERSGKYNHLIENDCCISNTHRSHSNQIDYLICSAGLNVVSEFNLENITEFGTEEQGSKELLGVEDDDQEEAYKTDMKYAFSLK